MNCNYCEEEFIRTSNNQKYCSEFCKNRLTKIKKQLRQKRYHNTLVPRTCDHCGILFRFHGMKKNCKECVEHLKKHPYNYKKGKQ